MNRFSTPEEIFGPVSIKALKQDQYLRKTEHYLPKADFAFLDEIFKASPAILNTLLTLLNEKMFKNGEKLQQVPLRALMSAANEIPIPNQGLDAIYDRFIMRLLVKPIAEKNNFHALLQAKPSMAKVKIEPENLIKLSELDEWRDQIYSIQLNNTILQVFDEIKQKLNLEFAEQQIYVSDRRWQKIAYLVKASAFLNDRSSVNLSDLYILKYCIWNQEADIEFVSILVNQCIEFIGLGDGLNYDGLVSDKEVLEKQMLENNFYTDDVYESYLIKEKEYLKAITNLDQHYKNKTLYLELNKMGTKKDFFAVDETGEEIRGIVCNFNGTRQCYLKGGYYGLEEIVSPYIKYEKGSKRSEVSAQIKYDLLNKTNNLKDQFISDQNILKQRFGQQNSEFESLFITNLELDQLRSSIQSKIDQYDLQIKDMMRLEVLCKQ